MVQSASLGGSETRYAPMLGFGAEYALVGPWSILAEYNYHHLSAGTARLTGQTIINGVTTAFAADNRIDQAIHVARLGVNYRFGNDAPAPSFAPMLPAPGTDWTGAYIGAQGGYGWGRTQWPDVFGAVGPAGNLPHFDNSNWLAGGTIGVNAQSGRFVFGVEGEMLATGIKGNFAGSDAQFFAPGIVINSAMSSRIDWLALASARAGFVVGDSLMLYGKGGVAVAEERHAAAATQNIPALSIDVSGKAIHTGALVGAGGEYAIAPNWSVKAEYNYIKMFAQQVQLNGTAAGGPFGAGIQVVNAAGRITQDLQLVKFGVNYHFNPQPGAGRPGLSGGDKLRAAPLGYFASAAAVTGRTGSPSRSSAPARATTMSPSCRPEVISTWPAAISPVSTRRVSTRARRTTCTTVPAVP